MNYGKAFREIREENNLTRKEVALKMGVATSTLSKIERHKTEPKSDTIETFCRVAHVPLAYFYQKALTIEDYYWPMRPSSFTAPIL